MPKSLCLVFVLLAGCGEKKTSPVESEAQDVERAPSGSQSDGPAVDIDAARLAADFVENEIAAEGKWKGRRVRVSGSVARVRRSNGETIVSMVGARVTKDLEFALRPGQDDAAARLAKGDRVAIQGIVLGAAPMDILIDKAVIDPSPPAPAPVFDAAPDRAKEGKCAMVANRMMRLEERAMRRERASEAEIRKAHEDGEEDRAKWIALCSKPDMPPTVIDCLLGFNTDADFDRCMEGMKGSSP